MKNDGIGQSPRRKEDRRFITGTGQYTDDITLPKQSYAFILRSPLAHARIESIDTSAAEQADGVIAVFTGADVAADELGGVPCGWGITDADGNPMAEPTHPIIVADVARHVGDQIAVVIAESKQQAKNAAELIEVDYTELDSVVSTHKALDEGSAQVWPEAKNNLCFDWEIGDQAAVSDAFGHAHHISSIKLVNNRLIPNAMEPRSAIGDYDAGKDCYTLYTSSQNPHVIRLLMGAFVLNLPEHKLRVVAPDVGGGFGSKIFHYAEEAIVTWASKKVGRPIKWTAERNESFQTDAHGRDHVTEAQLALDANGKFLGLKVDNIANMGAYLSTFGPSVPTILSATLLAGTYTTPAIHCRVRAVFTNTAPVDAYRGAGRPEATYLLERLVNVAATDLGIDQAEIRRRNFIPTDAFPYQTPVALQYDTGDFHSSLERALDLHDYDGFAGRRAQSEANGKRRGIGLSTYIEACGIAPSNVAGSLGARAGLFESAQVRVHPTGTVSVFTGSHSHGQGHETTFAQIVATRLGLPIEDIEIVHGDTDRIPFGMGTYGSRSLAVGGAAIMDAVSKVIAKATDIAAHLLDTVAAEVVFAEGSFSAAGRDKQLTFAEVAFEAYVPHNYPLETMEPGLDEVAFYDPKNFTFPAGAYICEVEVDPETGVVSIEAFSGVDDFGNVINPMIVEGQVHGGLAQGIGQALLEQCIYDDDTGQLMTASFLDYSMPRAADFPNFSTDYTNTPCTHNELGVKGCGEAGAIGSPPAVINAVLDALAPLGVEDISMPVTPLNVWQAINQAETSQQATQQ